MSYTNLGHPLYVNGQLFAEPVTISHVPGPVGASPDGIGYFGADAPSPSTPPPPPPVSTGRVIYGLASTAAAVAGAYHGYKRNKSAGWAVGWFLFGSFMPFLAMPIALAQGFGKPKEH